MALCCCVILFDCVVFDTHIKTFSYTHQNKHTDLFLGIRACHIEVNACVTVAIAFLCTTSAFTQTHNQTTNYKPQHNKQPNKQHKAKTTTHLSACFMTSICRFSAPSGNDAYTVRSCAVVCVVCCVFCFVLFVTTTHADRFVCQLVLFSLLDMHPQPSTPTRWLHSTVLCLFVVYVWLFVLCAFVTKHQHWFSVNLCVTCFLSIIFENPSSAMDAAPVKLAAPFCLHRKPEICNWRSSASTNLLNSVLYSCSAS